MFHMYDKKIHTYIHTHIYTYIHTHTRTFTHRPTFSLIHSYRQLNLAVLDLGAPLSSFPRGALYYMRSTILYYVRYERIHINIHIHTPHVHIEYNCMHAGIHTCARIINSHSSGACGRACHVQSETPVTPHF